MFFQLTDTFIEALQDVQHRVPSTESPGTRAPACAHLRLWCARSGDATASGTHARHSHGHAIVFLRLQEQQMNGDEVSVRVWWIWGKRVWRSFLNPEPSGASAGITHSHRSAWGTCEEQQSILSSWMDLSGGFECSGGISLSEESVFVCTRLNALERSNIGQVVRWETRSGSSRHIKL